MTDFKFEIGERVTERPRLNYNISSSPRGKQLYAQHTKQRYGTVVGHSVKKDARGATRKIIAVIWDGKQSPSEHEQMRLCKISELPEQTNNFRA